MTLMYVWFVVVGDEVIDKLLEGRTTLEWIRTLSNVQGNCHSTCDTYSDVLLHGMTITVTFYGTWLHITHSITNTVTCGMTIAVAFSKYPLVLWHQLFIT